MLMKEIFIEWNDGELVFDISHLYFMNDLRSIFNKVLLQSKKI